MRRILILVLVLVAGAATWPVYVGIQVENALSEPATGQIGEIRLDHRVTDYRRDRYGASADGVLQVTGRGLDFALPVEHRIRHHLLGASAQSRLVGLPDPETLPARWRAVLQQAAPRADSWLGLGGGVNMRFATQSVRLAEEDASAESGTGFALTLGAGQGGLAHTPERIVVSFDMGTLEWVESDNGLRLENVYFGLLLHPGEDGGYERLPDYDIGLGAGSVSLQWRGQELMGMDGLQMSSWQNSTQERLDSLLRLRADAFRSAGLALEAMDLHLSALRWSRPALLGVINDLERVRAMELAPDLRAGLLLGVVLERVQEMIGDDPVLQGHLRLHGAPGRHARVQLDLGLRGDAETFASRPLESVALIFELEMAVALIEEFVALFHLEAGATGDQNGSGADAVQKWLELAVAENWIRIDDGVVHSRLEMEQGRLLINERDQTVLLLALVFGLARGMF